MQFVCASRGLIHRVLAQTVFTPRILFHAIVARSDAIRCNGNRYVCKPQARCPATPRIRHKTGFSNIMAVCKAGRIGTGWLVARSRKIISFLRFCFLSQRKP